MTGDMGMKYVLFKFGTDSYGTLLIIHYSTCHTELLTSNNLKVLLAIGFG